MSEFTQLRETMVDCQVQTFNVFDRNLLKAMRVIPREKFVPETLQAIAYSDGDIPLLIHDTTRFMMRPMALARLIQLADLQSSDLVLDIGCLTGYSTAIIAQLVESVVGLCEGDGEAQTAQDVLTSLDIGNAPIVAGNLTKGLPNQGPYDVIFIQGSVDEVPKTILDQLKEGGKLITVQTRKGLGEAGTYINRSGLYIYKSGFDLDVPQLPMFQKIPEFTI